MDEQENKAVSSAARVFILQPHRIAAAWRRLRFAGLKGSRIPDNLLDDVVESFVRELGEMLYGKLGSPWARARGVLRLSPERGEIGLREEFAVLRRCLADAIDALGGTPQERVGLELALDEAVKSAVEHYHRMVDPNSPAPEVPFGGLVVEYFERPSAQKGSSRGPQPWSAVQ